MKLLTLNCHSLQEKNAAKKQAWFVDVVARERPDLIALQEVNQTRTAPLVDPTRLAGFCPDPNCPVPVRWDNHAAEVANRLRRAGLPCTWTWTAAKVGYGIYDEGLALFSLTQPIAQVDAFRISHSSDYENWRTRKVLGVRLDRNESWFYTVHMGWWQDPEEPFQAQWQVLEQGLESKRKAGPVWLLGDFNGPAEVRDESYDLIRSSGWKDTYTLAQKKDSGLTVEGVIDGWRDKLADPEGTNGMRIDQIWCSQQVPVANSYVMFNGKNGPQVSDHYGVQIEAAEPGKGVNAR